MTVSSIGDAKSLQGGTLILTPLKGIDGQVYAVAQGSVSIGGISAGDGGNSVEINHPTVGRVPNGANIERVVPTELAANNQLTLVLRNEDFSTAAQTQRSYQRQIRRGNFAKLSTAEMSMSIVPASFAENRVGFIAAA